MGIMVPDTVHENTTSNAERRIFRKLERELGDDCCVLHSLGTTNHLDKLWAECDFVILCHGGIFVLEVKGGGVSCHDGVWTYTNRHGTSDSRHQGPFGQAVGAMFAIKNYAEREPDLGGLLWGWGVVIPDDTLEATGAEIVPEVLWDSRDFDGNGRMDIYVSRLSSYWQSEYRVKHGSEPRLPDRPTLDRLRRLLRPEVETRINLASSLNRIDREQIELTDQQITVMRGMYSNPRTLVSGAAGTGKTLLAVDRALHLAAHEKKVLLLCFNRLLSEHLREAVMGREGSDNITISTIHAWYRRIVEQAGMSSHLRETDNEDAPSSDFYTHVLPAVYADAALVLGNDMPPFDAVVVDEAQDLLTREHMDAIDLTLAGGLHQGSWHFFLDPQQDIFNRSDSGDPAVLDGIGFARYNLTVNCRNTLSIAVTTTQVSCFSMAEVEAVVGGEVHVRFYDGRGELQSRLDDTVARLIGQELLPQDMIILSTRRREKSAIAGLTSIAGQRIHDLTAEATAHPGIDFCTVQAFKGLDRKAVIAVDIVDLESPDNRMLHYCALSRARSWLSVFIPRSEEQAYQRNLAELASRAEAGGTNFKRQSR